MSDDNAALTATIKAGAGYDAPWLVVRADTPDQMAQRLNAVVNGSLTGPLVAAAQVLQAEWSGNHAGANPGGQTFQGQGNGGFNGSQGGGGDAFAGGGNAGGGGGQQSGRYVETHPKGWGTFEHGHPEAPNTLHGPKVLKRAKSQAGNAYAQWLDPRDPAIPSVYAAGNKSKPADYIEPEFAKKGI